MKFVLAFYGTRGDVEPGIALGRDLVRRGHAVHIAVPPDLVGFAEAAGPTAVGYRPETQAWLEAARRQRCDRRRPRRGFRPSQAG